MPVRLPTFIPLALAVPATIGAWLLLTPALSCADELPAAGGQPVKEAAVDVPAKTGAPAATPKARAVDVEFKLGSWLSTGKTKWSHNSSALDSLLGNPSSALTYKDVGTNIVEFGGKVTVLQRVFLRADYGFGGIGGGRLTDDDYLSAAGATFYDASTPGAQLVSRTYSDINGNNVSYINLDVGAVLYRFPEQRGALSTYIGYQYWREAYTATGLTSVVCTAVVTFCDAVGTVSNVGRTVIANTTTWNSLKVGLEGDYNVWSRLTLGGNVAFIPYTSLDNRDIHYLRNDLAQNPSFKMTGNGLGVNAEGTASVRLVSTLFFDLGYRFWYLNVSDGTWQAFSRTGTVATAQLKDLSSTRQGVTLGLRYSF